MVIMELQSPNAPTPIGPYSQAIQVVDGHIYVSGCLGFSARHNALVKTTFGEEVRQALYNLGQVLSQANSTFANVVKVTIYLASMKDFKEVNDIYMTYFAKPYPARTTLSVKELPLGARVEIDVIAYNNSLR